MTTYDRCPHGFERATPEWTCVQCDLEAMTAYRDIYRAKWKAYQEAIHVVRNWYPEAIFPDDGQTSDARHASWARSVCDSITEEYEARTTQREADARRALEAQGIGWED